ncbi:MAG: fibronectin type III domain-containing protein [Candidatus Gracilibacteria bacterium]|nr:fibronectin type III domain-containing protein [Candidatus Gracilibacteria bacterium]
MHNFLKKLISSFAIVPLLTASMLPALANQEVALKVMNSTAGVPVLAMLQGSAGEMADVAVSNPYGSTTKQKIQLSDTGTAQYWYYNTSVAGNYQFEFNGQKAISQVLAGQPNIARSDLDIDYTTFADQVAEGLLTLKDSYGNPVKGYELSIQTKKDAKVSCSPCLTNGAGQLAFTMKAKKAGLETLTIANTRGSRIFTEEIGFIPRVSPYQEDFRSMSQYGPANNEYGYIPVFDPTRATSSSQGNNDQLLGNTQQEYLAASLFENNRLIAQLEQEVGTQTQSNGLASQQNQVAAVNQVSAFDLYVGQDMNVDSLQLDTEVPAEPKSVTISANSAQDIYIRAVDSNYQTFTGYEGTISFELDPLGPLLPPDFVFNASDQGDNLFELALILPAGDYTLSVKDTENQSILGEIQIISQFGGGASQLNNTNITLSVDSPVTNGVYSQSFSVIGTVSSDNTQIVIKEGALEIARGDADENKSFNIPVQLTDGEHDLDIIATYLVDGSQVTSTMKIEIDQTPPVITSYDTEIPATKAGETFTMNAVAESGSTLEALIDNRSYTFVPGLQDPTQYTLSAVAPALAGDYDVTLRIADNVGNTDEIPTAATLTVGASLQELKNLFGIPGVGTMTLSWDPVEGADSYEISYKTPLSAAASTETSTESSVTIENLVANTSYIFTVWAKDTVGADLSLPTETRALRVLDPPPTAAVSQGGDDGLLRGSADQDMPMRHTSSGPEVYLLIFLSLIVLNCYGQLRKAFARI